MSSDTTIQYCTTGEPLGSHVPQLGDDEDTARVCTVCGGHVERVGFADVQRGTLVRHYRCKGECRGGGALIGQESPRRIGPIFTGRTKAFREAGL